MDCQWRASTVTSSLEEFPISSVFRMDRRGYWASLFCDIGIDISSYYLRRVTISVYKYYVYYFCIPYYMAVSNYMSCLSYTNPEPDAVVFWAWGWWILQWLLESCSLSGPEFSTNLNIVFREDCVPVMILNLSGPKLEIEQIIRLMQRLLQS